MKNESAILNKEKPVDERLRNQAEFDALEEQLQEQLEKELENWEISKEEREKIADPDHLGNVMLGVVWEQFMNQVAVKAGEDFIKDNNGLHLDLRKEAHIQTTDNFAKGKIATHNTKIDYQERYDKWQKNFEKDENGNVKKHTTRTGKEEATLKADARKPYDQGRPSGSKEKKTDMDHTVSAGEIIRDAGANAHLTEEERISFANSDTNLNEMNANMNRSKGDLSMEDWLDSPNSKGQKPREIFDMDEKTEKELREKDKEAREEYEKRKKEGEQKSIEAGKQSRKEEAFRIGGKALRAAVMQLLAELAKEIFTKLVQWFKTSKKELSTLLDSLKEAIHSFVGKLKTHIYNATNTVLTTIVTAIVGPVVGLIKKAWMFIKQGWSSLKEAIDYIKSPENKGRPMEILVMEVGKILIAGLTATGAIVLGEVIEKGLMVVPGFAIEIPFFGSLANVLGIFVGAVVSGLIGAMAINFIDKLIANKQKAEVDKEILKKGNEILILQEEQKNHQNAKYAEQKITTQSHISERHTEAHRIMKEAYENIMEDFVQFPDEETNVIVDEEDVKLNKELDEISSALNDLLDSLE